MKFMNRNGMLYININGKRKSTFLKDTKANRKLVESRHKNDKFFYKYSVDANTPKVKTLCEKAIDKKRQRLKVESIRAYEGIFKNWIIPYFNDKYITEIRPKHIAQWYDTFKDRSTLITAKHILKQAFSLAKLEEYITESPMIDVQIPLVESDYEPNPFTLEEMSMILNHKSNIQNILGVAFFTGMRMGEIIALKWSDIDFKNETIDVQRRRSKGREDKPKTKSSKAKIDLPIEALKYFENERKKNGLREYVFYSSKGKVYNDANNVTHFWKKVLKELNIKHRGIHQTRHTFASLKISMGERIEWVSYMLRHETMRTTIDTYYRYIPRKKEKRVIIKLDSVQKRHTS